MNDKFYNNLKDDLKPYYSKGDCCSWIVELRKENNKLQSNWNSLREELYQANRELVPNELVNGKELINNIIDIMNELEGKDND